MKKSFKHYFKRWYVITPLVIMLIVATYLLLRGNNLPVYETAVVSIGDVVEEVSVTGKVLPVEKADLSFEKGGVVAKLNVGVGSIVKKGDLLASLESAGDAASLASAEAKLDDISRSLRPEETKVEQSKVQSAKTVSENAKREAGNAFRDGYTKIENALVNYTDQFFSNPQSVNPTTDLPTQSYSQRMAINRSRLLVRDQMMLWKADIYSADNTLGTEESLAKASKYLEVVSSFFGDLSIIVNDLSPSGSGMTQSAIDGATSAVNAGSAILNQAITSISTAQNALRNAESSFVEAQNNLTLKNAGSSAQVVRAQAATVASFRAELEKNRITSPIDGIITKVNPSLGEYVSPGLSSFSVQSDGIYKIEANIPEADIAKVTIGNTASITLDAYGQNVIFGAVVTTIDPAETVLEGVPTYKVTLQFVNKDERIRSGMTANTDILTRKQQGVLMIPTRALADSSTLVDGITSDTSQQSGKKIVRVLESDGKTISSVPVIAGLKGSEGTTEIISGLSVGQKVVTYVKP